jgi:hypothetical protein
MASCNWLTIPEIIEVFTDEIETVGGEVPDVIKDKSRMFARSVLPPLKEIKPGDDAKGGVALRASQKEIWIHPYVLRRLCANGHITPHAVQTTRIGRDDDPETILEKAEIESRLRDAIRACCSENVFTARIDEMQTAIEDQISIALFMLIAFPPTSHDVDEIDSIELAEGIEATIKRAVFDLDEPKRSRVGLVKAYRTLLLRLNRETKRRVNDEVLHRFAKEGDDSRFGLMNAITSVARNTRDPEARWHLEKLGGMIPVIKFPDTIDWDGFQNQIPRTKTECIRAKKVAGITVA